MTALDRRCPTCDARPGERCQPDGATHIGRYGTQDGRVVLGHTHEPTIDERQRVAATQAQIRETLGKMRHR